MKGQDGQGHLIHQKTHNKATEVVRIWKGPNGYMSKHVFELCNTAKTWSTQIFHITSPNNLTWVTFSCSIWSLIMYPLPVNCIKKAQSTQI